MVYIVYKITNLINNKIYIGFHYCKTNNLDDGYMGSGKLIKRAIKKYGVENFEKEILKIFKYRKDAEDYEKELVNKKFVLNDETYNLSIGGNVLILHGKHNGFYGKFHSEESINKIQISRTKTIRERGYTHFTKYHANLNGHIVYNLEQLKKHLGHTKFYKIFDTMFNNDMFFIDEDFNNKCFKLYKKMVLHRQKMKKITADRCSKRFKGVPKSEEHKNKIGNSHRGKKHEWQNKINKNPEKIRKTAEKHRGMKRTDKTKMNISKAVNSFYESGGENGIKGKNCYYHYETKELKYFGKDEIIPDGYKKGNPRLSKKCYYDPITLECKRFKENEQPSEWLLGNPNARKPKNNKK